MYIEPHTNFHSSAFRHLLMPSLGHSVITLVSSQHIRMVISYKRLWNN